MVARNLWFWTIGWDGGQVTQGHQLVPFLCYWCHPWLFLSRLSYLISRRWSAVENALPPVMDPISLLLARRELKYLLLAHITVSYRHSPYFLAGIILKIPTMGERYFNFPRKIWCKQFSQRISSTLQNAYSVSFVTRLKNIHSDGIAKTAAA